MYRFAPRLESEEVVNMRKYFAMALLLAACSFIIAAPACAELGLIRVHDQKPTFIYVGPANDGGYNYMHDQGRKFMERQHPGIKCTIVDSVPEGKAVELAIKKAIQNGSKVIFANSFGYMDRVMNVARDYPDVYFMHCSGYKTAPNVGTYFGRMYQPRYLSGIVAGAATRSDRIGFVAAHPTSEVIRAINAFTLGARKANPRAQVKVVWTFAWSDSAKERAAVKTLFGAKCDTIAMHVDGESVPRTAEKFGMWVVGYNSQMDAYAPTRHLVSTVWNWGIYYDYVVQQIKNGTWKPEQAWWSMKDGIVGLSDYGRAVGAKTRKLVDSEKQKILDGEWDVFCGPIKGQDGKLLIPEGKQLSDAEMLSMSWFVEGVDGKIPR